jgi:hypothetical protein
VTRLRLRWTASTGLRRCNHRSRRLGLPCLREWQWQCKCDRHNKTCFNDCPREKP